MARYRHVDLSLRLMPVDLEWPLAPGTFAHAVHHLIDDLGLSAFDALYLNDDNGSPAHSPRMLLKTVLLAYSQGMVSSRCIERGVSRQYPVHCNRWRCKAALHDDRGSNQRIARCDHLGIRPSSETLKSMWRSPIYRAQINEPAAIDPRSSGQRHQSSGVDGKSLKE